MFQSPSGLTLSATDLSNFSGCRHHTALDMAVAAGAREQPHPVNDPLLEILWERGAEHERNHVESLRAGGRTIVDLAGVAGAEARVTKTLDAMHEGADIIVQGALRYETWSGKPDIMCRVETGSALGSWSYEIIDTKLARETRAGTIMQLGLYSEMLASVQGARPVRFHVVTPDTLAPVHSYRVDDYAAYFRLVRSQMLAVVEQDHEQVALENYPEPVEHCEVCRWGADCRRKRRADDHLSLVAGITRAQRRELESRSIHTLTNLAGLPLPLPIAFAPKRGSAESYERVREQARLQLGSRGRKTPLHELLAIEAEKGLCRLPQPSPGDLFLDLEGDPFAAEGGREYLFGLVGVDGEYHSAWALTEKDERAAFEWVMDRIATAIQAHPGMHVYHYAPYEPAAFKRLMGRYATRESDLDAMLRAGRFVDLYAVVRQGLRAGVDRYSIKNLEPLYGYPRAVALGDARRSLKLMEQGLEMGMPSAIPEEVRDVVQGYNRDDCVSTLWLRDFLEQLRGELVKGGTAVPRKQLETGTAPDAVDEKAQRVEALRARLLAPVPELRADRNDEQQGRWLLAYLLDYHRREDKASWWEYFRLCDLAEEDLHDERAAAADLRFVERIELILNKKGKPTGSVVDRYRYPAQEMEIDRGCEVWSQDRKKFGDVTAVDREAFTIEIRKGPSRADLHPRAVFSFSHVASDAMENALFDLGESVAAGNDGYAAARALLASRGPAFRGVEQSLETLMAAATPAGATDQGSAAIDAAVRLGGTLEGTVLAIQGPPGSGKTYCGSRMICELVRQGKRVGITASGHTVIRNLLVAVGREADTLGAPVTLAHKGGDPDPSGRVQCLEANEDALAAHQSGSANVVGGTAWLWARPEFASSVDVLFVDEAGQMSLANVLAVSRAANSVVLLGDPQQLEQPRKGSHPDRVNASALEHILGDHQTIPSHRGIFLPVTWRLAPSICAFTSELFYERRLTSREGLDKQRLLDARGLPPSGLIRVDVHHTGNRNASSEEIDVVAELVMRLTSENASWCDADGIERKLVGADMLVVAPYNAQVTRLASRLAGTGARVGTVDKFQGQEAPVVIYSMASSSPEDAPRGMEFLYSLNRLNVATSRARCLAILVASPRLFDVECHSPRQMKLANALCRFREMAGDASLH